MVIPQRFSARQARPGHYPCPMEKLAAAAHAESSDPTRAETDATDVERLHGGLLRVAFLVTGDEAFARDAADEVLDDFGREHGWSDRLGTQRQLSFSALTSMVLSGQQLWRSQDLGAVGTGTQSVLDALRRVPLRQRLLLALVAVGQMSVDAAAEVLGYRHGQARRRLRSALKTVRRELGSPDMQTDELLADVASAAETIVQHSKLAQQAAGETDESSDAATENMWARAYPRMTKTHTGAGQHVSLRWPRMAVAGAFALSLVVALALFWPMSPSNGGLTLRPSLPDTASWSRPVDGPLPVVSGAGPEYPPGPTLPPPGPTATGETPPIDPLSSPDTGFLTSPAPSSPRPPKKATKKPADTATKTSGTASRTTTPPLQSPSLQLISDGRCLTVAAVTDNPIWANTSLETCRVDPTQLLSLGSDGVLRNGRYCVWAFENRMTRDTPVGSVDCSFVKQTWVRAGRLLVNWPSGLCLTTQSPSAEWWVKFTLQACKGGASQEWVVHG